MIKYPSCSFHSSFSAINTSQLQSKQKSILLQYQKLKYNHQTPQYSMQVLPYLQLPKYFDKSLKTKYTQCILLDKFTFFQMFTMMIAEYLFKAPNADKLHKINKLKALIYSEEFLEGNTYTKGLLIKGIKQLEELTNLRQYSNPLGQSLLNCDSICAFTECWKELVAKICKQNSIPPISQHQIDSSIFQLFASFFHINFQVYWKQRGTKFWKQYFTFDQSNNNTDTLTVVVNPQYQISISQRSIRITQSRSSGMSGISSSKNNSSNNNTWNYILLTNPPPKRQENNNIRYTYQDVHIYHHHQQRIVKNNSHNTHTHTHTNTNTHNNNNKNQIAKGPNDQQISHISQIQYSCGQTEQIKILLDDDKVLEIQNTNTAKKVGNFKKQTHFHYHNNCSNNNRNNRNSNDKNINININDGNTYEALTNIMNSMNKANYLIQEMKKYTEYLEKLEMPQVDGIQLRF